MPQVACFDTAFHRGHSAVADHYAIRSASTGRRAPYGFHGLSYEYIAERLRQVAPNIADGGWWLHISQRRLHVRPVRRPQCRSTLGFTALDGLPMAPGQGRSTPAWCSTSLPRSA